MYTLAIGFWALTGLCILACIVPPRIWARLTKQPLSEFWIGMVLMAVFLLWHSIYPAHDLYVKGLIFLAALHYFSLSRLEQRWGQTLLVGSGLFFTLHLAQEAQPWDLWFRVPWALWLAVLLSCILVWTGREHPLHFLSGILLTCVVLQFFWGHVTFEESTALRHDAYYTTLFDIYWMSVLSVCIALAVRHIAIHRNPSQETVDLTKRHS